MENFDREQAIDKVSGQLKTLIQENGYTVMGVGNFVTYSIGVSMKPQTSFEFVVDTKSVQLGNAVIHELVRRVNAGEIFEEEKAYESDTLKLAKDYDPKERAINVKTKFMMVKVDPWTMYENVTFWWDVLPNYKNMETCYLVVLGDKDNVLPMEKEGYNKDNLVKMFFLNKTGFLN